MTKRILVYGSLLALLFTACKQHSSEQENNAYRISGDTVHIYNESPLPGKISTSVVEEETFSKEVSTAGTVQAIPTQFAYIAPPFSGRVTKTYIKLGQHVQQNTPLFEIISADFTAAQKEFYQAQSERDLARNDLKRKQDLLKNGVASQKELEEASNALIIAEKEYENAYAAIKIFQANPENMVLGQPLIIRSPISGKVIENNLVSGQYIKDDAESAAIVADLSKVWVVAQVKEKDIRFIHEGADLDIYIPAFPDNEPIKGKVYRIDESVDEETRSVKVLVICDNKDNQFKLGMYTTIHFWGKPAECIIIPEKALLQDEKDSYVYIQTAPNTYLKTPVEVEVVKDGKAVITKGLKKGETIISEGGYYLK